MSAGVGMLSKKYKLPREAFRVRGRAISVTTPLFRVISKPNALPHNRFGVVVGTSVDKRATVRNRIKRTVYDNVRAWPSEGRDIVVIVSPKARGASRREIIDDMKIAQEKALS